ncbi:MAG: hypothetical protein FDZ70_00410 [Actinobacteria bacterium]|nr:MAG: hypothetical protein FDZ70_00410 [Actinomycetota bacterium]
MPRLADRIVNSGAGLALAAGVARGLPEGVGRGVARRVAEALARRRDSEVVRALRANRWVVSGCRLGGDELDGAVRETLLHQSRCLYDTYRLIDAPRDELLAHVTPTPEMREWVERHRSGEPMVVAGPHLSAFDLAIVTLGNLGLNAQVLTPPDPGAGYRRENRWRARAGLRVTPASMQALREADRHLGRGGAVVTGIDRPMPDARNPVRFFGRLAPLTTAHVRLAVRSGAPLLVPLVRGLGDGRYEVGVAGPVPLDGGRGPDAAAANAERVLEVAAETIRQRPEQWQMPHAVWPEALAELDALEGTAPVRREEGDVRA